MTGPPPPGHGPWIDLSVGLKLVDFGPLVHDGLLMLRSSWRSRTQRHIEVMERLVSKTHGWTCAFRLVSQPSLNEQRSITA
jgi:hypothetical protein